MFQPPQQEPFDSPTRTVIVNEQWLSFLLGQLGFLENNYAWSGTPTEIAAIRQAVLHLMAYLTPSEAGVMQGKAGTYTGNNTTNRAITGVGFQPDLVMVIEHQSTNCHWAMKTSADTTGALIGYTAMQYNTGHIVSLDADGFTVSTGSGSGGNHANINSAVYTYWAIKF